MDLELYDCPHCATSGVLPTSDGRCPNCKQPLAPEDKRNSEASDSYRKEVPAGGPAVTVASWGQYPQERPKGVPQSVCSSISATIGIVGLFLCPTVLIFLKGTDGARFLAGMCLLTGWMFCEVALGVSRARLFTQIVARLLLYLFVFLMVSVLAIVPLLTGRWP